MFNCSQWSRKVGGMILSATCLVLLFSLLSPSPVAALPAGFQEYYVLGNEEQLYNMFDHIDTQEGGSDLISSNQMCSIVTVVATADNQVFYYDHWEDGYEADLLNPTQDTTEVYGDGDISNGGSGSDTLGVGDILTLKSDGSGSGTNSLVPVNPRGTNTRYDGGDYVVSTGGPVDLAHAMWPQDTTWIGGAWEVYSLQAWSESYSYRIPVGVDSGFGDFVYVWLQVEALYDDTTVTIDNGTDSVVVELQKGETYSSMGYIDSQVSTPITVNEGTTISSNNQTQVGLVTGGHVEFQTRFFVMIPDLMWGTEYIAAIPRTTANGETEVYLYNPNDHSITVEAHDASGDYSITIAAGAVEAYSHRVGHYIPSGSSVRLNSDDTFWGLVCADTSNDDYDWGFSLIPSAFLKDDYYVCWAPGNVIDPITSGNNASPVWVAPIADDTTFYVDYGPVDGVVDETFVADAMETRHIFDPDIDNTGMHIWATNKFVPIWGIDPSSGASGEGYLDLGYTILPLRQDWLEPVMTLEKTADPQVLPLEGGQVTFFLETDTHGPAPVTNVDITDTLPISWTYTPGSTIVTYADGSKGYPEPTINGQTLFWDLSHTMYSNESLHLQFDAQIQTGGSVGATRSDDFEEGQVYDGGTDNWASPWTETDSGGGGPTGGRVNIANTDPYAGNWHLRIRNDASITRSVDLTDFAKPMLHFRRRHQVDNNNEYWYLEIYDGIGWTRELTWTNNVEEGDYHQEKVALSPYISGATAIRFTTSGNLENGDYLYIDDVRIYDAVLVNENEGWVSGKYRNHVFNVNDTAIVYINSLSVVKAVDRSTVNIGETILYTLTCQNSGGVTTTGTYVNDTIPWGTTVSNYSSGGTFVSATNTISWTIGDVGPSETKSVTLTVTVDNGTPDSTVIENFGRVNSDQTEMVNSNLVETIVLAPDLNVTKSGPGNANEGSVITYTIQYANNGGAEATGVVITDTIPTSTTYQSGSLEINTGSGWVSLSDGSDGDAGTFNGTAVVVQPGAVSGTVSAGESGAIRFSVQIAPSVPDGTSIINYATVDRDDANPWNTTLVATAIKDLTIEKVADQAVAVAGDVIEYTLTYGNHGAITETNIYIYDTIPAHSTYVSGTVTGAGLTIEYSTDNRGIWTTTVPTDVTQVTDLRWSRAELLAGVTGLTAGFHVQVQEELPGDVTLSNYATISSTESGLIYSNIVDVTTIDLVIYKAANSSFAFPGDTVTYTLTYGNNGSANATSVRITDTLPISTSYVANSITGNGADDSSAPTLVWNLGTVVAGTSGLQASYAVTVDSGAVPGTDIANTALIANVLDSTTSNENKVIVASAGLSIGPNNEEWGHPGHPMTYSHSIVNTGSVTDTAQITFSHSLWPTATTTLYHDQDGDGVRDPGDPVITTTTGVLEAGEEYDILLILTIPSGASDSDVNHTTITATSTISPELSSNTVDTTHIHHIALNISKTATPAIPVAPGTTITYTLTFANDSSETFDTVVITDSVPVSVTKSSLSVSNSGAAIVATGSISYVWELTDLAPGAGGVITITGTLSDSLPSETFSNTAIIVGTVTGVGSANDSDSATITVDADAPTTPTLGSPADGTATNDTTPTLDWNPATDNGGAGVAGYNIQIGPNVYIVTAPITQFAPGPLADGTYTWTVRAYDNAGNYGSYADAWSFTIDTTAPDTNITAQPSDPDNDPTPAFQFSGSDANGIASYECQMDGGGWFTCTSPHTTGSLGDGSHTFEVRAVDNAGNPDPTPASYTWTIDTAAPDAPVLSSPADGTVTSTNQLTLSWNAVTDAAGYLVDLNGSVFDVGNTTFSTTNVLVNDTYTWTVAAYDEASNTSPYTDIWSFTITNEYTLNINTVGSGSVTAQPDKTSYFHGELVTLTATAAPGWSFDSWSGDASSSSTSITVTMNSNKTVTATFKAPDEITLTASPASIMANGLTTATLTATVQYEGVPQDGAPVVFTTTWGVFPNWQQTIVVTTTEGTAVTWLRSVPVSNTVASTVRADVCGTFTETQVTFIEPTCIEDMTAWAEYTDNPIFGQGIDDEPRAYYPSVLYSPTAFDGHGDAAYYKMWFGTSGSRTGYAISDDGIHWVTVTVPLTDINGYHAHVLYDAGQFSGHGDAAYYKMWYWDASNSVHYATSSDGVNWTDYADNPVITNSLGWGSAPVYDAHVIYNSDGNPAYYEAWIDNNGRFYYITSTNGINWTGNNQELLADREDWESSTYSRLSVLKLDGVYHMWYGGSSSGGGNHGIGYAVSSDGQNWVKSVANPILHIDDGAAWRDNRTYTPRVLYSATRFDGHGSPEYYKMWFTGRDITFGNYAIGYATLNSVSLSLAETSGSGQSGQTGNPLDQPFQLGLRDNCGAPASDVTVTFTISDTPDGATGQSLSVISGTTNASGQITSVLTLGDTPGVYTVTAKATGVLNMPTVFTATAVQPEYTLTVITVGNGSVVSLPAQATYTFGQVVTLTAAADPGWSFDSWSGDASGPNTTVTVTMDTNKSVTATFTQNQYSLDIAAVGSGNVVSQPAQSTYTFGQVVTLTATADPGWFFNSWSGDASGSNTTVTVTIDGAKSVTATFTQDQYILDITTIGSGSVISQPAQATYTFGQVVTLTATADPGWSFDSWSGDASGSDTAITVTMDADKFITATFTQSATPGVTIFPTTVDVEEDGVTDTYSVNLNSEPASIVTISIVADGQTTVTPNSLAFDATNWDTVQQVTVTAVDDDQVEGVHVSTISHNATSADGNYDGITITNVTANVTDNDAAPAPVSVQFNSATYSVKETASMATITVTLSGAATMPVTVTYATSDGTATAGSDYTAVSATLRFDVGQTHRTFAVPVFGDTIPEDDETVSLTLSAPVNATLGTPNTATLTIENNALYLPLVTKNHG